MDTITCINCGLRGAAADAFCTRCGMSRTGGPGRGPATAPRPASGSGVGKWIAIVAVCGFGAVFVLGILAAIAIPKFANVSAQAKAAEAPSVLRYIHDLQEMHLEQHGAYTANLDGTGEGPPLVGYEPPAARYFTFAVSRATDDELCIEAEPSEEGAAAGLSPASMDAAGTQYTGPGCASMPPRDGSWANSAEQMMRDSEAKPVLARIHLLQTQFREQNGRFASDLTELAGAEAWDNRFFTFSAVRATEGELCVDARLTAEGRAAGLAETSIDEAGQVYLGQGCSGTRVG